MVCVLPLCEVCCALSAPNPGLETKFHPAWLVTDSGLPLCFTPKTDWTVRDAVGRSSRAGGVAASDLPLSLFSFPFVEFRRSSFEFRSSQVSRFYLQTWPVKEACNVA